MPSHRSRIQYGLDTLTASDSVRRHGRGTEPPDALRTPSESPYGAEPPPRSLGVPHIEAESELAAIYAVGYVQAFDRMFPMDLQRRIMRGQLAEIAGEGEAGSDEFHRQDGLRRCREGRTGRTRRVRKSSRLLQAFADGVNGVAGERARALPRVPILPDPDSLDHRRHACSMERNIAWNLTGQLWRSESGKPDRLPTARSW
ncbi:MAG: penicillin acylase family protein [Natrialbaceae archaeon]|nr:penicillin acylase family protein [Natrialbaceae archaeon]